MCVAVVSSATSEVAGRAKRISQSRAGKLAPRIRPTENETEWVGPGRQWKSDSGRHRVLPSCHAPASLRGIRFSFHDRQRAKRALAQVDREGGFVDPSAGDRRGGRDNVRAKLGFARASASGRHQHLPRK